MQYDYIILRYGELVLKGRNRKQFISLLHENIKKQLSAFNDLEIKSRFDHVSIELNGNDSDEVAKGLRHVFGVQSINPIITVPNDEAAIKDGALAMVNEIENTVKTFKVSARRKNKAFPITSQDLNYIVGSHVLKNTESLKVDVHKPDLDLRIEVRGRETRIFGPQIKGAGGLPAGASGKVMLMLSGGIDSPVAGYMLQKRGATIEAIHFHSPPYTNDRARQKVVDLAQKLNTYGNDVRLHIVPFTEAQIQIRDNMPENYRMTIMRRMMMRIAERIAEKQGALALATGESIGQVASQTLESMNTINEVTNLPILRPLVSMDKIDIMQIAHDIDTYDISIRPYEDCCTLFLPRSPKTKPDREHANRFEQYLAVDELVEEAVKNTGTVELTQIKDEFEDLL